MWQTYHKVHKGLWVVDMMCYKPITTTTPTPHTPHTPHQKMNRTTLNEHNRNGFNGFVKGWVCGEEKGSSSRPWQRRVHRGSQSVTLHRCCITQTSPLRLSSSLLLVESSQSKNDNWTPWPPHWEVVMQRKPHILKKKRKKRANHWAWCWCCCSASTVHWRLVLFPLWPEVGWEWFCIQA